MFNWGEKNQSEPAEEAQAGGVINIRGHDNRVTLELHGWWLPRTAGVLIGKLH